MRPAGTKPRVLVVDENALSNSVMTLALRVHGFPCFGVASAADALTYIDAFEPDVVILEWADRVERRVDEATRIRFHARAAGRSVAVIVVTQEYERPSTEVLGSLDGYFTKPVVLESLEQMIIKADEQRAREHRRAGAPSE